jgi:hypothetical protein
MNKLKDILVFRSMREYKKYYFPEMYEKELIEQMTQEEYVKHLIAKSLDKILN